MNDPDYYWYLQLRSYKSLKLVILNKIYKRLLYRGFIEISLFLNVSNPMLLN